MRILYLFVFIYVVLVVHGQLAMAETVENDDIVEIDNNVSSVVGDWVVEPHLNKLGIPTGHCTMTAEFDNGVQLSFKSGDRQISALRVTGFNNPTSEPLGYIAIGFEDNTYGLQSRSTPQQIDASLLTIPAPAQAIMELDSFTMKMGTNNYAFSTYSFKTGFDELILCETRHGGTSLAVVSDPIHNRIGEYLEDMMPADPVAPVMGQDLEGLEPMDVIGNMRDDDANEAESWTAARGERLEDVLKRWTDREGVKLLVDIGKNPVITDDFTFDGDLNTAVNLLIAENPNLKGLNTTVQDDLDVQKIATTIDNRQMTPAAKQNISTNRWRALQGTNLRKVLKRWAQKENINFIWDADQEFFIRQSVKKNSDFNSVVAEILNQFSSQSIRPQAILNKDPKTGQTSLIITSSSDS